MLHSKTGVLAPQRRLRADLSPGKILDKGSWWFILFLMRVILDHSLFEPFAARLRQRSSAAAALGCMIVFAYFTSPPARPETHAALQAVKADGTSAWTGTLPFTIRGVLVSDPEEFLNSSPNHVPWNDGAGAGQMGGEWQVFIQAVEPGDRGGTALWMGQNYGNLAWIKDTGKSYTDEEWLAEMNRVCRDPVNNHRFRKGDLVEISANRSLFYGGKRNINEAHDKNPEADFSITLVRADFGCPEPELIGLADLVRPDDGDPGTKEDIFDETRQTGGEHYQGMRVRINGLRLVDAGGWGEIVWAARKCLVTDGKGRFFTVRNSLTNLVPAPTGEFDAIGILNQESGSGINGTFGYELFVQEVIDHEPPVLRINVITWPASAPGFRLEAADSLNPPVWRLVTARPAVAGGRFAVQESMGEAGQRFYRLVRDLLGSPGQ